ncbi:MAG: LCP family protein [Clostridiaceae bacterium]
MSNKIKDKKTVRKILIIVVPIMIAALASMIYFYMQLKKIEVASMPETNQELNISDDAASLDKEITNIALLGLDKRSDNETGRSDSIMILSIDRKHNKLKLLSIMRDTYVNIEGHDMTKINHAYAYGGENLSIKTLNQNFNLNIKDFVTIDFQEMKSIVNSLGGVEIEIKDYELKSMKAVGITTPGKYNLNGEQALAYSRIRYQGNGDYERTERQRTVLMGIFEKIRSQGALKYPSIASSLLPFVKTSLSPEEILNIGTYIFTSHINTIEQVRFPAESYSQGKMINGVYYLVTDLKATTDQINSFIYEENKMSSNK